MNITDNSASAEPVDMLDDDIQDLDQDTDTQTLEEGEGDDFSDPDGDDEGEEGDENADDALEDAEWEGKPFKAPKGVKEAMLRHDDYTKKTQAVAEQRKVVETRAQSLQQVEERQVAFAGDIAKLGALNARLEPFAVIPDWANYIRQGGPQAQADYAEYQALTQQRDAFARTLGEKVQQRTEQERQQHAQAIEAGRAELSKHIKGYGPETLSKMETFAAPLGFSPEEIRDAEADPRSLRILHLAMVGQQVLQQQKRTSTIAQGAKTSPVKTLRGTGGRISARPDTDDFAAFERQQDERAKATRK